MQGLCEVKINMYPTITTHTAAKTLVCMSTLSVYCIYHYNYIINPEETAKRSRNHVLKYNA